MYTNTPEYRVTRNTELHTFVQTGSSSTGDTIPGYHTFQSGHKTLRNDTHRPANEVLDRLVAEIRDQGKPDGVLSDVLKTQTRRTIRALGWRTVQIDQIHW